MAVLEISGYSQGHLPYGYERYVLHISPNSSNITNPNPDQCSQPEYFCNSPTDSAANRSGSDSSGSTSSENSAGGGSGVDSGSSNVASGNFNSFLAEKNQQLRGMDLKSLPREYHNPGIKDPKFNYGKVSPNSSEFKPSGLLSRRGLSPMSTLLPPRENKSPEVYLKEVLKTLELYKGQTKKFQATVDALKKGSENFYPHESTPLFREYLKVLPHLRSV